MPEGVNHAAHCTDGSRFYVIGGRKGGNTPGEGFDYTQVYDPVTRTWEVLDNAPLPVPRGGMGKCLAKDGKIYVLGGESKAALPGFTEAGVYGFVDVFDVETETWS